ncbi:MAG: hypothetical protein ABEJ89_09705 [Haloarculaceae archaeon]
MKPADPSPSPADSDRPTRRALLGGVAVVVAGVAGCTGTSTDGGATPTDGGGTPTGAAGVTATLSDYDIALSRTALSAGSVTFDITNEAEQVHEFVVFATDRDADDLPMAEGENEVEEDADSITLVDEAEDIEGGASATLTADFDPGSYVAVCNLPGHYELGMRAGFTVT